MSEQDRHPAGLRDAHVVVTGGSKGIGAAISHEMSSRGARLTLVARPSTELDLTAKLTDAIPVEADLGDLSALPGLVDRVEQLGGPVDILINNAAVARTCPYVERSEVDVQSQIVTNLLAPMLLSRQVLPGFLARGRGRILNVSSIGGETSVPHTTGYSASKAALTAFTACLQAEYRHHPGIEVLLLVLGKVGDTQMIKEFDNDPVVGASISRAMGRLPSMGLEKVSRHVADNLAAPRPKQVSALPRVISPLVLARLAPGRAMNRMLRLPPTQGRSASGT